MNKLKEVRYNLDEAAKETIVRPSVAIHHLLVAIADLTDVVEGVTSDQPSEEAKARQEED